MNKRDITIEEILSKTDHTNLKPDATTFDIMKLCDEAIKYKTASVCVALYWVDFCKGYFDRFANEYRPKVCTVIGFPCGNTKTEIKCAEAKTAIDMGADEIDMVINIGALKDGKTNYILNEINKIKSVCGNIPLKVIIEACLLSQKEKILACDIVSSSNADYIKTSTGFSTGGATIEDVELMTEHMTNGKRIKASGGIANIEDARRFIELGCDRLGTSKVVKDVIKREEMRKEKENYDFEL